MNRHPLITPEELADLAEIDRLLDEANAHSLARDGHCKSSEGHIEIGFGNHWDRDPEEPRKPVTVSIYSYLLGPHRSHHFDNTTQALDVVRQWHRREFADDRDIGEEDLYLKIERERREEFERMYADAEKAYAEFEEAMEDDAVRVYSGTLDEMFGQVDGEEF